MLETSPTSALDSVSETPASARQDDGRKNMCGGKEPEGIKEEFQGSHRTKICCIRLPSEGGPDELKGLNPKIEAGNTIALVGQSGPG